MESNIADEQLWSVESPAEPRFDEEATLLSARPVVPIEMVVQRHGFKRPWVFGFALAGALLLGVAATALYYSRFHMSESQPVTDNETVSSGAKGSNSEVRDLNPPSGIADSPGSGADSVDQDEPAESKIASSSLPAPARMPESSKAESKKPARRATVVVTQGSEPEYEGRDELREYKREAKEWKRAKRERRAGKASDELLRIRDIFEGPQRP